MTGKVRSVYRAVLGMRCVCVRDNVHGLSSPFYRIPHV